MSWRVKLVSIALVIVLAGLSKTFIEDKFRGSHPLGVPLRRTFIFLVIGMLVTASSGVAAMLAARYLNKPVVIDYAQPCVGAAMLLDPACQGRNIHGDKLLTPPVFAKNDKSIVYQDECQWIQTKPDVFPFCDFGSTDAMATPIALIGNSHAISLLEPIIQIAYEHNLSIRTYLTARCTPRLIPMSLFPDPAANQGCLDFTVKAIDDMVTHGVHLLIITERPEGKPDIEQDENFLRQILSHGINILVIRDIPRTNPSVFAPDCVAQNFVDLSVCDGPISERLHEDPITEAANLIDTHMISTVDFTNAICDTTTCYDTIGGIIVYRDTTHLTVSFAMTLKPYLQPVILSALNQA